MKNKVRKTYSIPVSVKGIVIEDGKVWLRKNERDEWELPGGKLDKGEQPIQTVVREMEEELGFEVKPEILVSAYLYEIKSDNQDEAKGVMVVSYLCKIIKRTSDFEHEGEAGRAEFKSFSRDEAEELNMPNFYKEAINKAYEQ